MKKKFDARDVIFARLRLIEGTVEYDDYYRLHPELKSDDDEIRRLRYEKKKDSNEIPIPNIAENDYDLARMLISTPALKCDRVINTLAKETTIADKKVNIDSIDLSKLIKETAKLYGADLVGISPLNENNHYSHDRNGNVIKSDFKYAIVIAVELDKKLIKTAPTDDAMTAAMLGYAASTEVSAMLSMFIKSLGYNADTDNHIDYYSPVVKLAKQAGLGQIGRCSMVVTKEYGPRVKIAATLTDMPLIIDKPVEFGLYDFCTKCKICARKCPVDAINSGEPKIIDGEKIWDFNEIQCMKMWTKSGTDCGICMDVCPYSNNKNE